LKFIKFNKRNRKAMKTTRFFKKIEELTRNFKNAEV